MVPEMRHEHLRAARSDDRPRDGTCGSFQQAEFALPAGHIGNEESSVGWSYRWPTPRTLEERGTQVIRQRHELTNLERSKWRSHSSSADEERLSIRCDRFWQEGSTIEVLAGPGGGKQPNEACSRRLSGLRYFLSYDNDARWPQSNPRFRFLISADEPAHAP